MTLKDWTLKNPKLLSVFVYISTAAIIITLVIVAVQIHNYGELLNKAPCDLCQQQGYTCFGQLGFK